MLGLPESDGDVNERGVPEAELTNEEGELDALKESRNNIRMNTCHEI